MFLKATSFNTIGDQQQVLSDVNPLLVPLTGSIGAYDLLTGSVNTGAGATPQSGNGGFTYTSDTTSITWSWYNMAVVRNDGTTQRFTGSQKTTGLTSNTIYYFYSYFDDCKGSSNEFISFLY